MSDVATFGPDDRVKSVTPHVGLHHHAGAAAIRGVIDRAMPVGRILTKIMDIETEDSRGAGLAHQRQVERREVLRKDRDDVDPHGPAPSGGAPDAASSARASIASSASLRPGGGSTITRPPSISTVGTIAATNGISTSPAVLSTAKRSCPGTWITSLMGPMIMPSRVSAFRPTSW